MKFINVKMLLKIKHRNKINFASLCLVVCYIVLLLCFFFGNEYKNGLFVSSLFASVIIGSQSSLGDLTIYGFLKALPSKAFNGFAAGAGFSGVIGALLPIVVTSVGFDMKWVSFLNRISKWMLDSQSHLRLRL